MTLPAHGLTRAQLNHYRFGLASVARRQCKLIAPEMRAFKAWLTDDIRLDRAPGLEQSGNHK